MTQAPALATAVAPAYAAIAASDALRRGQIVGVGGLAILSAELADAAALAALETGTRAGIIITARRAAVLNLANQLAAAAADPEPVWVERPAWLDLAASRAVADPVLDMATPLKGPFTSRVLGANADSARAAIALAKHAALLPAVYAVPIAAATPVPMSAFRRARGCRWRLPRTPKSSPSALPMAAQSIWRWSSPTLHAPGR